MSSLRLAAAGLLLAVLLLTSVEAGLRGLIWGRQAAAVVLQSSGPFPVYVLGESTAYGEPFAPRFSFPTIMAGMLPESVHGRPLEVVNLARSGSNTEEQYWRLLRETFLRPRPEGIVLIYAGINEDFPQEPPSRWRRLADRSLVLSKLSYQLRNRGHFTVAPDYEHRLERLVSLARARGLPVVVSTLAGNVRDFGPSISWAVRDDPGRLRTYEEARRQERLGRWRQAAALYESLCESAGPDPGLRHRLAVCYLRLGRSAQAGKLFWEAIDQGGTKRPTTGQNRAVRSVARRRGAALTDSLALFAAASPHGLPGYELFLDAHHPNAEGALLLASGFARQTSRLLNVPLRRGPPTPAQLRQEAGFSAQDEGAVYASRFLWFCGEAAGQADPSDALARARRYLALAESRLGRRMAACRLFLALAARDDDAIAYWLARRGQLLADAGSWAALGVDPGWTQRLVAEAGLTPERAAQARELLSP